MRLILAAITLIAFLPPTRADITIYRDSYGIPSIVASSTEDAIFGLGYATAQDNAERMALNYKQARGRLAEVQGSSALIMDGFTRSLGIEAAAIKRAEKLDDEVGKLVIAFCEGANRSIAEQKGSIPIWIEPITPVDVLSLAQLINAAFPLRDLAAQMLPAGSVPGPSVGSESFSPDIAGVGSNQFAVARKRSASGNAILSADPHLPWDGVLAWYEFGVDAPGYRFRGITLPGLPLGAMGHTDRVAWCMTNNSPDLFDIFTVKTNPQNPGQYSYHGEWRPFELMSYELRSKGPDGMSVRRQTSKMTAWGPMLPLQSRAVAFSMIGSWDLLEESLRMARARDVKEFREALRPRGISMFNVVYADNTGKIGYQYNGRVPKRDATFDWTKPVPGDDPKTKWGPLWTIDELPHVENPSSDLLLNANSTAELTPLGPELKDKKWPTYVASHGPTTRFDNLLALLAADTSITVDEAKKYATDTRVPYALAVKKELDSAGNPAYSSLVKECLALLKAWDGKSSLQSTGTTLYSYWYRSGKEMRDLARRAEDGAAWTEREKRSVIVALEQAGTDVKAKFGRLNPLWAEAQEARRGKEASGVAGWGYMGDSAAAVMPTFGKFEADSGKIHAQGGSSFRMIVELDAKGTRSWSILPYGNSNHPASKHYADQMILFARGAYKPTLFGLENIKKGAVEKVEVKR